MNEDARSDGRGRSILFVHGHDFKPDRETLLEISLAAVRSGIERDYPDCLPAFDGVHCDFAYYGDLNNELLTAHGRPYDVNLDNGDRRNALQALREIRERKRFGIRQYDRLPGKSAVPEFVADFIYPVLGLFGLAMPIIRRLSSDFAEYLRGGVGLFRTDSGTRSNKPLQDAGSRRSCDVVDTRNRQRGCL